MTIKQIFKKLEATNELTMLFAKRKDYALFIEIAGIDNKYYTSFDEFKKYIDEEYRGDYVNSILNEKLEWSERFDQLITPNFIGDNNLPLLCVSMYVR